MPGRARYRSIVNQSRCRLSTDRRVAESVKHGLHYRTMLNRVSLAVCLSFLLTSSAFAQSTSTEALQAQTFPVPPIMARAGIVVDGDSGAILASLNPHLHLPMASTTKIMTALLALKMGHLTDRIVVSKAAFNYEWDATVMGLHAGQVVTLLDLLYGLLLPSGADAANTIAIHYGGTEARFVGMMNREAALLGMHDTHYVNAHGLTAAGHYTSAYDLAKLAEYVVGFPDLIKVTSTRTYNWNGHILTNVNHVLFWYPGVDGIKPGYTDDAGLCQVIDAHRDGRHVIVVLLNTPNLDTDARNLLDFGLRDFGWVQSQLPGDGPWTTQGGNIGANAWVYFPASGHYVRGAFLSTYRADGGSVALGFPRTEQLHEGRTLVQYFQNGALIHDTSGRIYRLPLGLTPLPTPVVTRTPSPTATPTATAPSHEATVGPTSGVKGTPLPFVRPTPTPRPPTPGPHATPTPFPPGSVSTSNVFLAFQKSHPALLGSAVAPLVTAHGYGVQVFAYGALAYKQGTKTILLLPLGDRVLAARHYLPTHAGNTYPAGFAPLSVVQAVGWFPPTTHISRVRAAPQVPAGPELMPAG
jgi:D-alanyl-D-alanine carboxypeptidase